MACHWHNGGPSSGWLQVENKGYTDQNQLLNC